MYVRDLEMKSRYLEGECRRLGMLLQGCYAENQALRLSLQNAKDFDASMTKQESAVLLLGTERPTFCPYFLCFSLYVIVLLCWGFSQSQLAHAMTPVSYLGLFKKPTNNCLLPSWLAVRIY